MTPKTVVARMHPGEKKEFEDHQSPAATAAIKPGASIHHRPQRLRSAVAPHDMRWPLPSNPDLLAKLKASILPRGDAKARGIFVDPGWPMVFRRSADVPSQTRLDLAAWLTDAGQSANRPRLGQSTLAMALRARIGRNQQRLWYAGATPSHPRLLDFLASELIAHDWDTNHIHRLILQSSTYRLSSRYSEANAKIDPENRMLWRWTPQTSRGGVDSRFYLVRQRSHRFA